MTTIQDKRGEVLEAIERALKAVLADRPGGVDLDGQDRPAINPPTIKEKILDGDKIQIRAFTGHYEYRVTIEAVRP